MERNGGGEGRVPLRQQLEAAPKQTRRGGGGFVLASARASLGVCFLLVPALLLLQRWQAGPVPVWIFDPPPEEDGRGTCVLVAFHLEPYQIY